MNSILSVAMAAAMVAGLSIPGFAQDARRASGQATEQGRPDQPSRSQPQRPEATSQPTYGGRHLPQAGHTSTIPDRAKAVQDRADRMADQFIKGICVGC